MQRLFAGLALSLFALATQAAQLHLTEFQGPPAVSVYFQAANMPALRSNVVPITGSSVQSLPFVSTTRLVRIHCDVACYVAVGVAPAATNESMRLAAGQTEYFVVTPGLRLAVLVAAAP